MAESILFSFTKVDDFFETMIDDDNITTSLFDGTTKNFKIVLAQACPANISECLNNDGTLNLSAISLIGTYADDGDCALLWNKGVNNNRVISIADSSVVYDLADNTYLLKGAFLVEQIGGKVLAYSINSSAMTVEKQVVIPLDGIVWNIFSQVNE